MIQRIVTFLAATLVVMIFAATAHAEKRVALVVGNSAYKNVNRLDNPANDAKLIAETLRGLGFVLIGGTAQLDLDKPSFDRVVQAFGAQLRGADVGLFYYAGHGVQVRGANYLVPVDANPTTEADVDFQMLDTNLVLHQMEAAGTRLESRHSRCLPQQSLRRARIALGVCGARTNAGTGRYADFLRDPARQRGEGRLGRQQPIHQGAGSDDPAP